MQHLVLVMINTLFLVMITKRQLGTHFFSKKNDFPPKKIKKIEK
jgi:hypothetical protein